MAIPVPLRGLCSVEQIESIIRMYTKKADFKFGTDTQPTRQDVCNIIDEVYDIPLVLEWTTNGIIIPIVDTMTLNAAKVINAYYAAAEVETRRRAVSNVGGNVPNYAKKLKEDAEAKQKKFLFESSLPSTAVNGDKPTVHMEDQIFSTTEELYVEFDDEEMGEWVRMSKKF